MLLTEFKAKDKAAMLRCGGMAEGERGLGDTVAELLCLDPKTSPSTAAKTAINPTAPNNIIHFHFLLEG